MKKILLSAVTVLCLFMTGCSDSTVSYDNFEIPDQSTSNLIPVGSIYTESSYEGTEPTTETVDESFISEDGLCKIEKKQSYYEVTLDYENGSYCDVGTAYGKTLLKVFPEYQCVMEPYIYENIRQILPNIGDDYSSVNSRMLEIENTMPSQYSEEIKGFAEAVSCGERGFSQNQKISYEEAVLIQIIPDVLRGTSCSALSVWGDKSATGNTVTARILEWILGSDNQMCNAHCVLHMKNKEKSLTSISVMGMLSMITGVNNDGVFAGILDVGSETPYSCNGKKSYVYALRYALENFDTAKSAGEYMISESNNFTFSHNIIFSDSSGSYCAEDCIKGDKGKAVLRTSDTPLVNNLVWGSSDSLCVVNSFATQENEFSSVSHNIIRWEKFRKFVDSKDKISINDIKSTLTSEDVEKDMTGCIYSDDVFHLVIVDYSTGMMQAVFTGTDGVKNSPEFINIGKFN